MSVDMAGVVEVGFEEMNMTTVMTWGDWGSDVTNLKCQYLVRVDITCVWIKMVVFVILRKVSVLDMGGTINGILKPSESEPTQSRVLSFH